MLNLIIRDPNEDKLALSKTLEKICTSSRSKFSNSIQTDYRSVALGGYWPGTNSNFIRGCIIEKRWKFLLGIIPYRQERILFSVDAGFSGGAYGKKEIRCEAFNQNLLDVVHGPLEEYSILFQATAIKIERKFDEPNGGWYSGIGL